MEGDLHRSIHSAAMQDRDGALLVLNRRTRRFFPFITCIFADAGYQGPKAAAAIVKTGTWKLASTGALEGCLGGTKIVCRAGLGRYERISGVG